MVSCDARYLPDWSGRHTRYIAARKVESAANGTINRELAVLRRMLKLAYENGKLLRLLFIGKLKEAAPAPTSSSGRNSTP